MDEQYYQQLGQQYNIPTPLQPLPNGTAVLVLGIVSIVGCVCYGVVGLTCGIIALVLADKDTKRYLANPSIYTTGSRNNLQAGKICAIVGVSISTLFLLCIVFSVAVRSHYNFFNF